MVRLSASIGHIGLLAVFIGGAAAQALASELVAPGAKVELLAGGFTFTEGPACDAEGNVYFTDIPNERIHKWSVDGKLTTFRENSGKANGLYFDREGNLLACEGGNRRLTSISPGGKVTVLADSFQGKKLNSPNDLWVDPKGGVYFSDPRYGQEEGLEQDGFHVYYLPPNRTELVRVIGDLVKPNGVLGAADGKTLYVADAGGGKTYAYRIQPDGSLADRMLIAPVGADGMTRDERGNLYLARNVVHVYSPEGKAITTIEVPEPPANVCFGGKDRKTLFITARKGLYAVRMNVRGQ
ncbi:MAG: SMP-30/gluconolactonase/LRE family protein [Thermoguttaceae bacterium]|jgi:gluconolactonase